MCDWGAPGTCSSARGTAPLFVSIRRAADTHVCSSVSFSCNCFSAHSSTCESASMLANTRVRRRNRIQKPRIFKSQSKDCPGGDSRPPNTRCALPRSTSLSPKSTNMGIYRPRGDESIVIPHILEQALPTLNPTFPVKRFESIEFQRCELDFFVVHPRSWAPRLASKCQTEEASVRPMQRHVLGNVQRTARTRRSTPGHEGFDT